MSPEEPFYTETLAKIYFAQGKFQEAARIYGHLLRGNPEHRHLIPVFLEAERKALEQKARDVTLKLSRWIRLVSNLRTRKTLPGIRHRNAAVKQQG